MTVFHWHCQDCGSYCDSPYCSDALKFGREHRCNGRASQRPVNITPKPVVVKLDAARIRRLMRQIEKRQRVAG